MTIRWQPKRPAESRDYSHDWTPFLGEDTITSELHSASGVTLNSVELDADERVATFNVSGGTDGAATITQTITTAGGRVESETFILPVESVDEPVSLATARQHLRVLDDSEDAIIEAYIVAAREYVENRTGHVLKRRAFTQYFDGFDTYLELWRRPVVATADVSYTDADEIEQSVADFTQSAGRYPFRIKAPADAGWPDILGDSSVVVTYTAGYAPGEEPQALMQAILLLVGHWYTIRAGVTDAPTHEVPMAVHALCDQYRMPVV